MHNELTKQDIRKMEEEIEYRKLVVRPAALEDVKTARAHGDLSENFEYHAAKKVKNQNESRIRYLERMIKTAGLVSAGGMISTESPLGKALLGHKKGDRVYVELAGGGSYYVVIKSIENTIDDGTDKLRSF